MNIFNITNLEMATPCHIYSGKFSAFILTLNMQNYHVIINILLCLVIVIMLVLLLAMAKSMRSLKESALHDKENGKVWINRKLYDFDAEQLKILLKKINKSNKNDKQVENKN
jgi:hypothetical protein